MTEVKNNQGASTALPANENEVPKFPAAPAAPAVEAPIPVTNPVVEPDVSIPSSVQEQPAHTENIETPGMRDASINNLELSEAARMTKEKLSKEEKMPIFIPFEPGEVKGAYRPVSINGYRFEVKKGMMVPVPKTVAKLLMEAMNITTEVLDNHDTNLNNANEEKKKALNL